MKAKCVLEAAQQWLIFEHVDSEESGIEDNRALYYIFTQI